MITTSYSDARERLAELLERAVNDCEIVEIRRRGHESVAMIAMSELQGLLETAYLLRSPRNADRLLTALKGAQGKSGAILDLADLDERLERSAETSGDGLKARETAARSSKSKKRKPKTTHR